MRRFIVILALIAVAAVALVQRPKADSWSAPTTPAPVVVVAG